MTRTFLATYIGLFALLLVLFETRVKYTEGAIRRLFGFMFSYSGRTIFLIFLGAICFGMLSESYKDTNVSVCTLGGQRRPHGHSFSLHVATDLLWFPDLPPNCLAPAVSPSPPPAPQAYTACWGVGLATLCNALFNCFIVCSHPGFQNANKSGGAEGGAEGTPGDPAKLSDAQIRAYLEAHPELAAQAMGGGSIQARAVQPSEGVPEWGATATVSPAAVATAPSGVGFGGFFGGKKGGKKDAAGGGEAAGYVPPAVPAAAAAAPAAAAFTGSLAASDAYANDPFKPPSGGSAGGASPHEHHTVKVSTYAPPAVPAAAPPAVASTPEDDNPFASSDNPFESS